MSKSIALRFGVLVGTAALLLAVIATTASTTLAYFSDYRTSSVSLGAAHVTIDEGALELDLAQSFLNLIPGQEKSGQFQITNASSDDVPVDLYVWINPGTTFAPCDQPANSGELQIQLDGVTGASYFNICDLLLDAGPSETTAGTGYPRGANAPLKIADDLAEGSSITQTLRVQLTPGTNDTWENTTASADLVVYAVQGDGPAPFPITP